MNDFNFTDSFNKALNTADKTLGPFIGGAVNGVQSLPEEVALAMNWGSQLFQDENFKERADRYAQAERIKELFAKSPWFPDSFNQKRAEWAQESPGIVNGAEAFTPSPAKWLGFPTAVSEYGRKGEQSPMSTTANNISQGAVNVWDEVQKRVQNR